jgi:hypothetical protein
LFFSFSSEVRRRVRSCSAALFSRSRAEAPRRRVPISRARVRAVAGPVSFLQSR